MINWKEKYQLRDNNTKLQNNSLIRTKYILKYSILEFLIGITIKIKITDSREKSFERMSRKKYK